MGTGVVNLLLLVFELSLSPPGESVGVRGDDPIQLELIEDDVAQVIHLNDHRAEVVPRASLPPGAREGDVIVAGEIDREETARAVEGVREARRSLTRRRPR